MGRDIDACLVVHVFKRKDGIVDGLLKTINELASFRPFSFAVPSSLFAALADGSAVLALGRAPKPIFDWARRR